MSFDRVERWNKIQISQTPGKWVALTGVVLALLGLLGSLFIRPRRVWVRARRGEEGTLVEVAVLDRSAGADVGAVLDDLVAALRPGRADREGADVTDAAWEALSNQAVAAAGVVYFLALIAHLVEHAAARRVLEPAAARRGRPARGRRSPSRSAPDRVAARRTSPARPVRAARAAAHGDRGRRPPAVAGRRAAWPRTPTGCRGATCTSSRSPAPSWSPRSTCCSTAGSRSAGWRRSSSASC